MPSIYWELRSFAYDKFIIFIFTNLIEIADNKLLIEMTGQQYGIKRRIR